MLTQEEIDGFHEGLDDEAPAPAPVPQVRRAFGWGDALALTGLLPRAGTARSEASKPRR